MGIDFSQERAGEFERKLAILLGFIIFFFVIVTVRLFYLQIMKGNYFLNFSQENTVKEVRTAATRGVIFDRHRIPIAENRPAFDLALIPQHVKNLAKIKETLKTLVGLDPALVDQKWKLRHNVPRYYPLVVKADIPYDEAVKIRVAKSVEFETDTSDLRGVEVITQPLRSYPLGPIASNTLGYISEVSEKELARLQKDEPGRYYMGDLVGASGIEKYWEQYLRGRDGLEQKIIDAVGREIDNEDVGSLLHKQDAQHGYNLVLTLDSELQKFAEEQFADKSGALVAIDPQNGEVLAMVSSPQYDPEKLVSNVTSNYWATLVTDPRKLLLNRAIQGAYPPGSTYKVLTAIAALEEGVVKPKETIGCPGGLQYGGRFFKCWNHGGHGATNLHRSIAESCDTYYYQVGLRLGVDRIAKYAHLFGLGSKTDIDVDGEKTGLIPTSEWKKKVFKQEWQPGENLSIAVGQGYDTATPLQNALMVAQVASGKKLKPHLLKLIEDDDGNVIKSPEAVTDEKLPISEETLKIVRAAMLDTVESPGGTAHRSRLAHIKMAGKTGTAQVMSEDAKTRVRGLKTGDHAWFVVFAPYEDPKIAIAVIVEHGGFGASAAAPIAKAVIEKYLTPVEERTSIDRIGLVPSDQTEQAMKPRHPDEGGGERGLSLPESNVR